MRNIVTAMAPTAAGPDRQAMQGTHMDVFLTERELAARWQVASKTLRNQRSLGLGCRFVRIGRMVRYRLADILAFEQSGSQR